MVKNELAAVIWDMDGVLVDTGEAHFESWHQVFAERGVPLGRADFERTFGMNNAGILALLIDEELTADEVQSIGDRKEVLFRQLVQGKARPLPGVLEWLDRLKGLGIRQAIASSAPQENIDAIIAELGIGDMFQECVSGAHLNGKPDPATFLLAARRLGMAPEQCLVIEDAHVGIEAARRGGMKCVAVCTTHAASELADADLVVDRLSGLSEKEVHDLFF